MYKKYLFISICLLSSFLSCTDTIVYHEIKGSTMGTTYSMILKGKNVDRLQIGIDSVLSRVNMLFSTYIDSSLLSKVNSCDSMLIEDPNFIEVFNIAKGVHKHTEGYFDPTVKPLVDAYGFGSENEKLPDATELKDLMSMVGFDKITLKDNGWLIKENKEVQIDLSAIAKGYGVDMVSRYIDSKNIKDYMVEIGGEIRVSGKNQKGRAWRLGIDKPIPNLEKRELYAVVDLEKGALATSGNYRKFVIIDSVKYVHTIDPKTGLPGVSKLLSASVFHTDCVYADAYATALMAMGDKKAIEFAEKESPVESFLIYMEEDGTIKEMDRTQKKNIQILNK